MKLDIKKTYKELNINERINCKSYYLGGKYWGSYHKMKYSKMDIVTTLYTSPF